ncbi:uncharacterized protein LOC123315351 [Coccinella septempunctata]|uniref:uncharacterized protein LOC123315351 n=1 Tax=Coccinella septempunctata TaxID=41139 RepID=UPI001D0985F3|nr:uncharacterized protein LOC123315351 [Coccinella septempunctata]
MDKAKKARTVHRRIFTKIYNNIESRISNGNFNSDEVKAAFQVLESKYEEIRTLDKEVFNFMIEENMSDTDIETDCDSVEEYSLKFNVIKERFSSSTEKVREISSSEGEVGTLQRKFKLPQIELKKFGGDIRDWLHFWGLFKKLDEDPTMDNEEKFQYLILSTIPKSRARTVVESFPPTFENYPKAIEALKSRFGREELLIELYIRDLIGLLTSNTKSLSMLYDKLECQLRALESLGITSDKCSAMLFPLVESCLPEELLRIWQRSYSADTAAAKSQDKVKKLMDFIRNEVENEEKVSMAKSGVGSARAKEQKKMMTTENNKATPYTASELVTTNNEVVSCIFCGRSEHKSFECSNSQGIRDPVESKSREEMEQAALRHFKETVAVESDGRYVVHLPWIEGHPPLPSNYKLAVRRLNFTISKLMKDGYYSKYEDVFKDWLSEGIIEKVFHGETGISGHYLPHRPVLKMNSTTPVRPVFDASAHEKHSPSLNSCLEKGMNLIEQIPSILFRFRFRKYGVVADIKKAFLQIGLSESERDYLRFLWKEPDGNLCVFRHRRVVFGVISSPFLLGAVIQYHLQKELEISLRDKCSFSCYVIEKLMNSFYVDNCVTSVDSEEELLNFISRAKDIMSKAKFDLRGWEHNSSFYPSDRIDSITNVLGLLWDREEDTLAINSSNWGNLKFEKITKRTILSIAHRVFDPIGFTCPVTVYPKLLLQLTWKEKIGWDDELDGSIKSEFLKWFEGISYLSSIRIPRYFSAYKNSRWLKLEIHIFCDASQSSYAAVSFLRIQTESGVVVQLLQAKSKVAPLKKMSIPRLELIAATIGSSLVRNLYESNVFHDAEYYFWTDSSTVLGWIRQDQQWAIFVRNRVDEILKVSSKEQWRFVPGSMNPADLPSRGCTAKKLLDSAWWEGPEWLRYSASYWPTDSFCYDEELVAREKKKFTISCVVNSNTDDWYYKYFSVFHKTVYMLGWIRRFLHNCRYPNDKHCGFLSVEEINDAELVIFRLIQHDSFSTLNDAIKSLFPFKDESGVLRIRTKLVNLEDSFDFRYPIVLPKHPLVVRLIREEHERACHVGVQGLLCRLREKYWIIGGRKTVRSVISKCVICKRFMSKRLETLPSALPEDRVRDVSVFEVIGIDLTGPVHLRDGRKAWIAVFTCAVYRAIHLELLTSLSTEIFIQSLRRFIARRGRPKIIYSDNGTNFVGAYNMFKSLDWSIVTKFCSLERIIWKFNPPAAPWWGGFWERLIRILKNLLRRTLGKASLNFEEMFTVLCDCEAVINSRPITFLSDSVDDLCPLTPAMFIQDIKEIGVNDCDVVECSKLTRRAKYRQKLGEQLRKRFRIEYLGQLKHRFKTQSVRQLKVGEVVLVGNDNSKRGDWPLACVTELFPGKDGSVRLVRLRTSAGEILRSVQRIFPLELDSYEEETEISNIKDKEHETQVSERADNILSRIFRTRKGCQTVKKCSG